MRYIEAPHDYTLTPTDCSLFLAGGISGCPDWQAEACQQLADTRLAVFNPRRAAFSLDDPQAAAEQIGWEHRCLRAVDAILFWFPDATLCPITLYELGAWSMTDKPLFVGAAPAYQRRADVLIQTSLVRPEIAVVDSLDALLQQVRGFAAARAG
jgi:hypothetical protein